MIDDFTVARINPTIGRIENLEILFFLQRARDRQSFALPVDDLFDFARVG